MKFLVQHTKEASLIESLPKFGLITDVIVLDTDDYYLVCEILHTTCFNSHFHGFGVEHESTPSYIFVKQNDLADHNILGLYKLLNFKLVVLKYHLNENIIITFKKYC